MTPYFFSKHHSWAPYEEANTVSIRYYVDCEVRIYRSVDIPLFSNVKSIATKNVSTPEYLFHIIVPLKYVRGRQKSTTGVCACHCQVSIVTTTPTLYPCCQRLHCTPCLHSQRFYLGTHLLTRCSNLIYCFM